MTKPSATVCDTFRATRDIRKMRARGIMVATWRGNPRRMFARIGAFISLEAAAECRRAGKYRLAKYAIKRAFQDHAKWLESGGSIP